MKENFSQKLNEDLVDFYKIIKGIDAMEVADNIKKDLVYSVSESLYKENKVEIDKIGKKEFKDEIMRSLNA